MTFTTYLFILFSVRFGLLSGQLFGKSCSLGKQYVLFVFLVFLTLVISLLVLRAGYGFFGFCLIQFLVVAFFVTFGIYSHETPLHCSIIVFK